MTLAVRFVAYSPNGGELGVLPVASNYTVAYGQTERGALEFAYTKGAAGSEHLTDDIEVAVQLSHNGSAFSEPIDSRFLVLASETERLTDQTCKYVGQSYAFRLSKAVVARNGTIKEGRRVFTTATPGKIVSDLFSEAQGRGALAGMTKTFSATADSNGQPWSTALNIEYDLGMDLLSIVQNLIDQGVVTMHFNGREMNLYDGDTGTDRTTPARGEITLYSGRDIEEAPERTDKTRLADTAYVRGDDDKMVTVTAPGNEKPWGRWEVTINQGGVTNTDTLTYLGTSLLERVASGKREATRGIIFQDSSPRPMLDYFPGDWIYDSSGAGMDRLRVYQVTLLNNGDGIVRGAIILNDRITEMEIALVRRVNGIVGGSTVGGGSGAVPNAPLPDLSDKTVPKAPASLSASTQAYFDTSGRPLANVTFQWAPVTQNTDNTAIVDLQGYEVSYQKVGGSWISSGIIADATLFVAGLEQGVAYNWKVRALDANGHASTQTSGTAITTAKDTTPPPAPTAPILSSKLSVASVEWDGKLASTVPADFSHLSVHRSITAGFTPSTANRVGTANASSRLAFSQEYGVTWYYKFVAYDFSGNASTPSPETPCVVSPVANTDLANEVLDGINADIESARVDAIDTAATDAQAKADAAEAAAVAAAAADAKSKADAAQAAATTAAASDAKAKADAAEAAAKAAAALDAQAKADAAEGAAKTAAAADAKAKADAAELAAKTAAASDAKAKADAAQAAAISAAAADAKTKADNAEAAAKAAGVPRILPMGAAGKIFTYPMTYVNNGNAQTGSIVIDTAMTFGNYMTKVTLSGFNYVQGANEIDLTLAFYAYSVGPVFTSTSQTSTGSCAVTARLARKVSTGTVSIILDVPTGVWYYPKITVERAEIGQTNPPDSFGTGWAGTLKTDLTGYDLIATPPRRDLNDTNSLTQGWRMTGKTTINGGAIEADTVTAVQVKTGSLTVSHTKDLQTTLDAKETPTGAQAKADAAKNAAISDATTKYDEIKTRVTNWTAAGKTTINGGQIEADTIDAKVAVKARSIGTQLLAIGSMDNQVPNGTGEFGVLGGWMAGVTGVTLDTTDKPAELRGAFKCAAGTTTKATSTTETWAVTDREEFLVEIWMKADVAGSKIYVELRDQANAMAADISASSAAGTIFAGDSTYPIANASPSTSWVKYTAIAKAKAGVTQMRVGSIYFNHANGTVTNAVQSIAIRVRRRSAGLLLVDGTIEAKHIKSNSITVDQLEAGFLNGQVVTGALIRTAASGARLELDGNGGVGGSLKVFTGSPNETAPGGLSYFGGSGINGARLTGSTFPGGGTPPSIDLGTNETTGKSTLDLYTPKTWLYARESEAGLSGSVGTSRVTFEAKANNGTDVSRIALYGDGDPWEDGQNEGITLYSHKDIVMRRGTNALGVDGSGTFVNGQIRRTDTNGWITPSGLLGGWSNYGAGYEAFGYRLMPDGTVRLRGLIKGGASGFANAFFTLPVGYRPSAAQIMLGAASGGIADVRVFAGGEVCVYGFFSGGTNASVSLGMISFLPAGA